jgi:hypothetical protein
MKINSLTCLIILVLLFSCKFKNRQKDSDLLSPPSNYKNDPLKLNAYHFLTSNMGDLEHLSDDGQGIKDITSIQKSYLIKNIDTATKLSRPLINKGIISVQDFYEYALPYRLNSSKIENWRELVLKKYNNYKIKEVKDETSLIQLINAINTEQQKWFKYGRNNADTQTLSFADLCSDKHADCVGMSYLAAYTLRGLGLPVSIDYTPAWGNTSGAHAWNSLVTKNKKVNPFLGAESGIGSYSPFDFVLNRENPSLSTYKKTGKVYRVTFSIQTQSLAYQYGRSGKLPPELTDPRLVDVTKDYIPVKDLIFKPVKSSPKFLVICNYNNGDWVPVMPAIIKNNQYVFKDMGRDLLYSPFQYNDQHKFNFYDYPVYVDAFGKSVSLHPNNKKLINIKLTRTQSIEKDQLQEMSKGWNYKNLTEIAKGNYFTKPINGKKYILYFWKENWEVVGSVLAKNNTVDFNAVPSNGLYLLSSGESISNERPFIIYNNSFKWL